MAKKVGKGFSQFSVCVPEQQKDKLKVLAKADNRSVSNYVATLIAQKLREEEQNKQ